jgi:hypothetical protein
MPDGAPPHPDPATIRCAVAPKPTSVTATERQGVPVNPGFTHGNPVPNSYPYTPEQTEWAVESGTHA